MARGHFGLAICSRLVLRPEGEKGCLLVRPAKQFLLVEPVAKTAYPPLGLMKIATMLKMKHKSCDIFSTIGHQVPRGLLQPSEIFITSLFTWDLDKVIKSIHFCADKFPRAKVHVGGIAATLLPEQIASATGVTPHKGLLEEAERCSPDYSFAFGRRLNASLTFASRGCMRRCRFCSVKAHEPEFTVRENWAKDVSLNLPRIVFWDNNWLASPNRLEDCKTLRKLGKVVDFNQGLDARLYDEDIAKELADIRMDPVRFAFDNVGYEKQVVRAIRLAKKYSPAEICVYVLYNFDDTPEDLFYRISLLNREGVLAFPMEYRKPTASRIRFPGPYWNTALLRALKLSLMFYYRKGMITESKKSLRSIYGRNAKQFVSKLYEIYDYDKKRAATRRKSG